jgi:subtilisin family serine protease
VLIDEDLFAPEVGLIENIPATTLSLSPTAFSLLAKLGNPSLTRLLIQEGSGRLPVALRRGLPKETASAKLDSYLTLIFPDELSADSAVKRLRTQTGVRYAAIQIPSTFSQAATTDPLFTGSLGSTPFSKQWGMYAINAPAAWSLIDGTAYVGVGDTGFQVGHEDFADTTYGNAFEAHLSINVVVTPTSSAVDERTTFANYVGHGTHVNGTIAARHNGIGAAGVCRGCSLMVARIYNDVNIPPGAAAAGLSWLTRAGAQVINLSLGRPNDLSSGVPYCTDTDTANDAYCTAIQQAQDYRTVIVAAAGNHKATYMQFPAQDVRTVSVGGLQVGETGGYAAWDQLVPYNYPPLSPSRSGGTNIETGNNGIAADGGQPAQIFAPARDIVAPMYAGYDWSPDYRCGTSRYIVPLTGGLYDPALVLSRADGFLGSGSAEFGNRYGICTGTSMATPHVTGTVALIRSANPLLNNADTKSTLMQNVSTTPSGLPYPNSLASVQAALSSNGGLTPLFIFGSIDDGDYFQTINPQMGAAALLLGPITVTKSGQRVQYGTFSTIGSPIAGYSSFYDNIAIPLPKGYGTDNFIPRAPIRVFTRPRDEQGVALTPLFRASYVNPDIANTTIRLRHYIAAGQAERDAVSLNADWVIDGIEGYLYSAAGAQPAGTSRILRGFNPTSVNWVLFPESDLAQWQSYGFTGAATVVGYAYLN